MAFVVLVNLSFSTSAAIIKAASVSRSDVAAAIATAVTGDTVLIPAGTASWTSGVTVSGKGIKIEGAGGGRVEGCSKTTLTIGSGTKSFSMRSGSTIKGFVAGEVVTAREKFVSANWMKGTVTSWDGTTLVLNVTNTNGSGSVGAWILESDASTIITNNAGSSVLFRITESPSRSVEISEIRFVKGAGSGQAIYVNAASNGLPVLLHDCRFSATFPTTHVRYGVNRGVIYRCYFDRGFNWFDNGTSQLDNSNGIHCENPEKSSKAWSTGAYYGKDDEDGSHCIYIEDCVFTGFHLGAIDFHNSVRGVFRHNVLDNSGLTTHGPDTAAEGVRTTEVYDCVGIFDQGPGATWPANLNYWLDWRGGSGVVTDNAFDDINSQAWGNKTEIRLECQMINRNSGPYACWTGGHPVPHQIGQGNSGMEGCYIWNNSPGTATGITQYSPDECGRGRVVTDYIQLNRDYSLQAKPGYVKFKYPHPLRNGSVPKAR